MIQLADLFCVLFIYNRATNIWLQLVADAIIHDPIIRGTVLMITAALLTTIYSSSTKYLEGIYLKK